MDRLTFEGNFCDIARCGEVKGGSFCEDGNCSRRKVWEKLKRYEDTRLEPSEIPTGLELAKVYAAMQENKRLKAENYRLNLLDRQSCGGCGEPLCKDITLCKQCVDKIVAENEQLKELTKF